MNNIRNARIEDLNEIAALESICFPPAEAADKASFEWRLRTYPTHFFVMEIDGKIVSLVNGPVTKEKNLMDDMYHSPSFSNEKGEWQMIFGLATHPSFQHQGFASQLMRLFVWKAFEQGRKGVVLTCKETKISFYASFGFKDEGVSSSTHGGVPWHQMRLTF